MKRKGNEHEGIPNGCALVPIKGILILLLIGFLSVSCMTVKRVKRNCDLFEQICITETETETDTTIKTETETKYRDTSVIVYIPEKVVKDKIPVKIEDERKEPIPVKKEYVNSALSVLKVPFAKSYAQVVNSRLDRAHPDRHLTTD